MSNSPHRNRTRGAVYFMIGSVCLVLVMPSRVSLALDTDPAPAGSTGTCQSAYDTTVRLLEEGRAPGLKAYRDLGILYQEITLFQKYTLTVVSEARKDLKASISMQSEDVARYKRVRLMVDGLKKLGASLSFAVKVFINRSDWAAKKMGLPKEHVPLMEATRRITELHDLREDLLDSLKKQQDVIYCESILPFDLHANDIHSDVMDGSLRGCNAGAQFDWTRLEDTYGIDWAHMPGEDGALPSKPWDYPQFFKSVSVLARVEDCRTKGIDVPIQEVAQYPKCDIGQIAGTYDADWGPIYCEAGKKMECTYGQKTDDRPEGVWSLHLSLNSLGDELLGEWDHNDGKTGPVKFSVAECDIVGGKFGYEPDTYTKSWSVRGRKR